MAAGGSALRAPTLPVLGQRVATTATFLVVTALVTRRALDGQLLLAVALLGAAALLVVLPRPRLLITLLLGLIYLSSFFGGLPTISLGGARSDPAQALAIAALVWVAMQAVVTGGRPGRTAFTGPLRLLALAFVVAIAVGLHREPNTSALVFQAKLLVYYLLPLAMAAGLRTRNDVAWFERCLLGVATVAAALTAVAAAFPHLLDVPTSTEVISLTARTDAQRLLPPAIYLVFVAFLLLVNRVTTGGFTAWRCVQLGLFVFALGVSFFRSLWVPLVLCTLAYVVLRRGRRVRLRGTAVSLVLTVAVTAFLPLAATGALGSTSEALVARLRSAVSPDVTEENSYRDRANESAAAWHTIRESPVLGVGLGTGYGISRRIYTTDEHGNKTFTRDERYFIHNTYLGIWIRFGLLGLAAFAFLGVRIVRECIHAHVYRSTEDASLALVAALALAGVLMMSALQTSLFEPPIVLAAACALVLLHGAARAPASGT